MSVWYCNSGILVHVLCNAEKEFGEYGGLVHMADVKDQWISIEQVAKYLGVSSVTVRFGSGREGESRLCELGGNGVSKKHPLMNGLAQEKAVLLEAYKCLGKMRQKTLSQHSWDDSELLKRI